MFLSGVYTCLRFLLDLVLIRLPEAERDAKLLLLRHELRVLRRSVKKRAVASLGSNDLERVGNAIAAIRLGNADRASGDGVRFKNYVELVREAAQRQRERLKASTG